jgi:hypothetical protein
MVGQRAVVGRTGEAGVGRGQQLHAIGVVERLDVDPIEPARVVVELHLDVERHRVADVCRYGKHVPTWTWPKSVPVAPGVWSHQDWASRKMRGWL